METEPNRDVGGINKRVALIVGSTGIVGGNQATLLVEEGWTVYGTRSQPRFGGRRNPGRRGSAPTRQLCPSH
jgi:nucleoside-diphosphate-sugar epimerase